MTEPNSPAVRGPLDATVVPLVAELDAMAAGWLCAGLPDADLPRRAAREIERRYKELGECSVGWESGTQALAENLVLRQALNKIAERTGSDDPCRSLVQIARNALRHNV